MRLTAAVIHRELSKAWGTCVSQGKLGGGLYEFPLSYDDEVMRPGCIVVGGRDMLVDFRRAPRRFAGCLPVVVFPGATASSAARSQMVVIDADESQRKDVLLELLSIMARFNEWDRELAKVSAEAPSYQELIDCGQTIIDAPFTIMEKSNKYVAASDSYREEFIVANNVGEDMAIPWKFVNDPEMRRRWEAISQSREAFALSFENTDVDIIGKCLFDAGEFTGHVGLVIRDQSKRDYYAFLLEHFHFYAEKMQSRIKLLKPFTEENSVNVLILRTLNGEKIEEGQWVSAISEFGWGEADELQIVVFRMHPYYLDAQTERELYADNLKSLLRDQWQGIVCFEHHGQVVVCVNEQCFSGALGLTFDQALALFLRENLLIAGISNAFIDPGFIKAAIRQSEIALDIGSVTDPDIWRYHFEKYTVGFVRTCIRKDMPIEAVCDRRLMVLRAYDKENDARYYETLREYFRCGLKATETAKRLCIQRSTLIYRMRRIRELTGVDFDDGNDLSYLWSSFLLMGDFA